MRNKLFKRLPIIGTIVLLLALCTVCIIFASSIGNQIGPGSTSDFPQHGEYKINSQTIIASLDRGDTEVFMPELETPEVSNQSLSPIFWRQLDYLKVANALHEFVWHEPLTSWNIYAATFNTDCTAATRGFGAGQITYFKTVWINELPSYAARQMTFSPEQNWVEWGGETNLPHPIFGQKGFDLSKFKISADDALRIAEENGGAKFRSDYNNECNIQLYLFGNIGWKVAYFHSLASFTLDIDPYTGTFKVLNSGK